MTIRETDNEMIDTGKSDTEASSDSEGEFQPVRRKKGQRRLKSTTTTDEKSNLNSSIKQKANRQAVDQNREPMDHTTTSANEQTITIQSNDIPVATPASTKKTESRRLSSPIETRTRN
ncbi:hypothetical protein GWI33_005178 [Rhynchophorus ferrugineus]|uniref:Uncharacterized protein n=1 Tax=Rhynchophorus ferrugineus TaxID=354439 RepID=A0A834II32_RHYFE|nr:hypothetical protein GWI33_005178 [Rhynchophorus ferrugineus]